AIREYRRLKLVAVTNATAVLVAFLGIVVCFFAPSSAFAEESPDAAETAPADDDSESPLPADVLAKLRSIEFQQRMTPVLAAFRQGNGPAAFPRVQAEGLAGLVYLLDRAFPETAVVGALEIDDPEIDRLIAEMGDPRSSVRERAFRKLLERGPVVIGRLRRELESPDPEIAYRASLIIEQWERNDEVNQGQFYHQLFGYIRMLHLRPEIDELIRRAKQIGAQPAPDQFRQQFVVMAVDRAMAIDPQKYSTALIPLVTAPSVQIRTNVARYAMMRGAATPLAEAVLASDDPQVLNMALAMLSSVSPEHEAKIKEILRKQFRSNDTAIAEIAAGGLWKLFQDEKAVDYLIERIASYQGNPPASLMYALNRPPSYGEGPPPEKIAAVVEKLLAVENNSIRQAAVRTLFSYRDRSVLERTVKLVGDKDQPFSNYVISILRTQGKSYYPKELLIELLEAERDRYDAPEIKSRFDSLLALLRTGDHGPR
ncbi:MAG: hypothetical protein D6741_02290, partial [Planctomycetota bacterium]